MQRNSVRALPGASVLEKNSNTGEKVSAESVARRERVGEELQHGRKGECGERERYEERER